MSDNKTKGGGGRKKDEADEQRKAEEELAVIVKKICSNPSAKATVADLTFAVAHIFAGMEEMRAERKEDLKELNRLRDQNKTLTTKNTKLEEKLKVIESNDKNIKKTADEAIEATKNFDNRFYHIEKKGLQANLILKNVAMLEEGKEERKDDTKKVVNNILKAIGVEKEVKIADCFRFKRSEKATNNKPPVISVKLQDPKMKADIFGSVNKLNGSQYHKISICNEYPASLREPMARAEKEAYEIRKDSDFKIKTRVEISQGKVVIKVKKPGDKIYGWIDDDAF